MKKLIYLFCSAFLVLSCEKEPDFDQLKSNYVVYTDYSEETDFTKFQTYFLPDSILEAGSSNHTSFWKDDNAMEIIEEIEFIMNERGYRRLTLPEDKENADLGLQVTYIAETNQVITGGGFYGGWWDYGYWGSWWDSWYYPFPVSYSYDTGTLIIELLDCTGDGDSSVKRRLPVVWYANAQGYRYSSPRANQQLLLDAVNQAFAQSQYITNK